MTDAERVEKLVEGGWDRDSSKAAIASGDWTLLRHTGQVTVKLEPPRGEG